jgi:hypothetical protein
MKSCCRLLLLLMSCGLLLACPSPPGSASDACPSPPEWLLVLLLLGLLLVACPSPPGMDLELQVLLHGFVGWSSNVFVVLRKNCGVLCAGLVLVGCELLALAELIFTSCWLSWAVVVLPAALSQSSDWAACVLLAYVLIWSISWTCCEMVRYPSVLYPQWLKEQILHLVIWTQWWKWHELCQNLRVTQSNPNSVSIWALFVLQVITSRSKWRHWRLIRYFLGFSDSFIFTM